MERTQRYILGIEKPFPWLLCMIWAAGIAVVAAPTVGAVYFRFFDPSSHFHF